MPVELSERELRDAIAVVGEWDREGAQAAQSAFEWLGWEGEEPLFLRRYDVQLCRAPETQRLLRVWEAENPAAPADLPETA